MPGAVRLNAGHMRILIAFAVHPDLRLAGLGAGICQREELGRQLQRCRLGAAEGLRESLHLQGKGHRRHPGARRSCDGGHAAALPRRRDDLAGGRVRDQPARSMESPLLHDRQRRPRRRCARRPDEPRSDVSADERLRDGAHQHRPRRAQGAERVVHPQQPAEGDRLRVSRGARDRGNGEGDRDRLLRAADHVLVLELLLERRPSGAARGAALPRRLRRHRRQRAVGRSDRVHDRRDLESEGAERSAGLAWTR